jgi:two-component system chemotaxis sensor kinase CheA
MEMDVSQYKELFISEAQEHLEALNQALLELEKDPGNPDVLTEIFRSAHTLKGMAATMGFDQLTELTHEMENVLEGLRSGEIEASPEIVDLLFACFDTLGAIVAHIAEGEGKPVDTQPLMEDLRRVYEGAGRPTPTVPKRDKGKAGGKAEPVARPVEGERSILGVRVFLDKDCVLKSVRVFMVTKKLSALGEVLGSVPPMEELEEEKFEDSFDVFVSTGADPEEIRKSLLTIAEVQEVEIRVLEEGEVPAEAAREGRALEAAEAAERSAVPPSGTGEGVDRTGASEEAPPAAAHPVRTQSIRVNISRLDNLMNLVGELVINRTRLQEIASYHDIPELKEVLAQTARLTAELQDEVMKTRMVPVEHIFNRFPRMVRDLAKSRGKEVDFIMEGKEIELDRTILEEISEPLMHLLRNAVDHGIDSPEEREAAGKPRRGTVKLSARRDRNYVSIEVSDDGKGVDFQRVFQIALEKGLVSTEERFGLGPEDALRIMAMPGFSTAKEVTGVSGRGVGLDVVKNKVESLGGMLVMESRPGEGTTFSLKLPLTLAIIQALLVKCRGQTYAIPLSVISETAMVSPHEVRSVSQQEVIFLREEAIPMARLDRLLDLPEEEARDEFPVVVVEMASRRVAVAVDELLGQQEIVISSLDKMLKRIKGFGGATILGTGEVALILDIPSLLS